MPEMASFRVYHGNAVRIALGDAFRIAQAAARLDYRRNAQFHCLFNRVFERKERVACHHASLGVETELLSPFARYFHAINAVGLPAAQPDGLQPFCKHDRIALDILAHDPSEVQVPLFAFGGLSFGNAFETLEQNVVTILPQQAIQNRLSVELLLLSSQRLRVYDAQVFLRLKRLQRIFSEARRYHHFQENLVHFLCRRLLKRLVERYYPTERGDGVARESFFPRFLLRFSERNSARVVVLYDDASVHFFGSEFLNEGESRVGVENVVEAQLLPAVHQQIGERLLSVLAVQRAFLVGVFPVTQFARLFQGQNQFLGKRTSAAFVFCEERGDCSVVRRRMLELLSHELRARVVRKLVLFLQLLQNAFVISGVDDYAHVFEVLGGPAH